MRGRTRKELPLTTEEIIRRYQDGESLGSLANMCGLKDSGRIIVELREAGIPRRSQSDVKRNNWARMTSEQRETRNRNLSESLLISSRFQSALRSESRRKKISKTLIGHAVSDETRATMRERGKENAELNFSGGIIGSNYARVLCPAGFVREHHVLWGVGNERFVLDFAAIDQKIGIELDGKSHNTKSAKERDTLRDYVLETLGWIIIRIQVG